MAADDLKNVPKRVANKMRSEHLTGPASQSGSWSSKREGVFQTCVGKNPPPNLGEAPKALIPALGWIQAYWDQQNETYKECANVPWVDREAPPRSAYYDDYAEDIGDAYANMDFSDIRLKTDIERVGTSPTGIPTYTFRYRSRKDECKYHGTMAQDILTSHPEAVAKQPCGYYAINYSLIDVDLYPIKG